jgi:hypothetical protein
MQNNFDSLIEYAKYGGGVKVKFNQKRKIDPIIIIDLYEDVDRQKNINDFTSHKKLNPIFIYLYGSKEERPVKNIIDEEICYDAIHHLYNKLEMILCNMWHDELHIKTVFIGDYKEYDCIAELIPYIFNNNKMFIKKLSVNNNNMKTLYACLT